MTVRLHTLSNGLRLATEEMPGLASTALGVWIGAGARHETEAQNGVAHFLEHMAFKGTERRTALDISTEIEDVGGYLNAYTSRDMTAYYARVLAEDAPLALDLIADILTHSIFAEPDMEVERHVILQEIGQSLDTPDDVIFDWLQEAAYPGQPFGRPILGEAAKVRGFAASDLRGFVSGHYAPDQMVIAAAGAVDHEALASQVEALFGGIEARRHPALAPACFEGGERRVEKPLEQAHLAIALQAPTWNDEALYAGQVFSTLLGGGMSSRLFQEAREKRGLCYSIFSQASAHEDTGLLTIYAGTGEEELRGLVELVADETARAAGSLTEAEAARARAQLKAGLLMGLESPFGRCERLARSLLIWNRAVPTEETVAKIEAVDAAAARAAGAEMIAKAPPAIALYGPVAGAPDPDALRLRMTG